jgi:hypothetical protein
MATANFRVQRLNVRPAANIALTNTPHAKTHVLRAKMTKITFATLHMGIKALDNVKKCKILLGSSAIIVLTQLVVYVEISNV